MTQLEIVANGCTMRIQTKGPITALIDLAAAPPFEPRTTRGGDPDVVPPDGQTLSN